MSSHGPRRDSDAAAPAGEQTMRVANAATYDLETPLYERRVGTGRIVCRMMRARGPAKRIVQLVAEYTERGIATTHVVQCSSETEEIHELARLERLILSATRQPT